MSTGKMIEVEGPNGVGKGAVIEAIQEVIAKNQKQAVLLREPGSTEFAEFLRPVIKGNPYKLGDLALTLLFNAGRADNCAKRIRPALSEGSYVVCDRYLLSTDVYQLILGQTLAPNWGPDTSDGQAVNILRALNYLHVMPDLVLICVAQPEIIEERRALRAEAAGSDVFQSSAARELAAYKIAGAQLRAQLGHERVVFIDTSAPIEEVKQTVRELIEHALFPVLDEAGIALETKWA